MAIYNKIVALCLLQSNAWGTAAFSIPKAPKASSVVLRSTAAPGAPGALAKEGGNLFPFDIPMDRIEGGDTLRTYPMPPDASRIEMVFKTNGRPMKIKAEFWVGPIRTTHTWQIENQDGLESPFRGVLRFKPGTNGVLKVTNVGPAEYPIECGVRPCTPERGDALEAFADKVWDASNKQIQQGDAAVRSYEIPANVKSVQVIFGSAAVGKRGPHAQIEILKGPNNKKQVYDMKCSGSGQPFHGVFETPGAGWTIRMYNKKTLEFPLEAVVEPYELE